MTSRKLRTGPSNDGDRKLLLGLLLAVLAVFVLFGLGLLLVLPGADDDSSPSGTAAAKRATPESTGTSANAGSLTAGGRSLLPVPDDLSEHVGQTAEGRGVEVQTVVEDKGFFVGTSHTDRVYIEYGGRVGETESSFTPSVGDRVDLTGPVRPAPEDPTGVLELDPDDSELVGQQGAYVNADTVEQSS